MKFGFGIIGADKKYHDSAKGETAAELTNDWQEYRIYLKGKDLKCIKSGFWWSLGGQGEPVTFYLDDVKFE